MGDVLRDLATLGYDAEWDCVPAAFVGAPHIRNRVWIVAYPQRGQLRQQPGRRHGQSRPGAPVAGDNGATSPLADAASMQRETQQRIEPDGVLPCVLADASGPGRRSRRRLGWSRAPLVRDGWWAAEPAVGRVAHGVPARMDRLRGLGNAVVPQVAEHIGRLIMAGAS